MRPRVEKPNVHERAARERKAARLTLAIEDLAEGTHQTALEVFGRLTPQEWVTLCVYIGQRKPAVPSMATQILVLEYLRERSARGAVA